MSMDDVVELPADESARLAKLATRETSRRSHQ